MLLPEPCRYVGQGDALPQDQLWSFSPKHNSNLDQISFLKPFKLLGNELIWQFVASHNNTVNKLTIDIHSNITS